VIIVIATVQAASGRRDELLERFRRLVPEVRAEEGCLEYGPAIDVETHLPAQGDLDPDRFVVLEKWASIEALEAHLIAPHMLAYRSDVKGMIERVDLQVLRPVGPGDPL